MIHSTGIHQLIYFQLKNFSMKSQQEALKKIYMYTYILITDR